MSDIHGEEHPICRQCFKETWPRRTPYRRSREDIQNRRCRWCGTPTTAGIYVSEQPPAAEQDVHTDSRT